MSCCSVGCNGRYAIISRVSHNAAFCAILLHGAKLPTSTHCGIVQGVSAVTLMLRYRHRRRCYAALWLFAAWCQAIEWDSRSAQLVNDSLLITLWHLWHRFHQLGSELFCCDYRSKQHLKSKFNVRNARFESTSSRWSSISDIPWLWILWVLWGCRRLTNPRRRSLPMLRPSCITL